MEENVAKMSKGGGKVKPTAPSGGKGASGGGFPTKSGGGMKKGAKC
jgi:hypothetical protein